MIDYSVDICKKKTVFSDGKPKMEGSEGSERVGCQLMVKGRDEDEGK